MLYVYIKELTTSIITLKSLWWKPQWGISWKYIASLEAKSELYPVISGCLIISLIYKREESPVRGLKERVSPRVSKKRIPITRTTFCFLFRLFCFVFIYLNDEKHWRDGCWKDLYILLWQTWIYKTEGWEEEEEGIKKRQKEGSASSSNHRLS